MTRTNTRIQSRAGDIVGSPCPFTTEFSDEICGAEADHWSAAVNSYLCGEHYATVGGQFAGAAAGLAGSCPECGEEQGECVCRGKADGED